MKLTGFASALGLSKLYGNIFFRELKNFLDGNMSVSSGGGLILTGIGCLFLYCLEWKVIDSLPEYRPEFFSMGPARNEASASP
jgi:hypothetical protein